MQIERSKDKLVCLYCREASLDDRIVHLSRTERDQHLTIIQGNVQKDHVHLVLEIPPNQSVSFVVGFLKGRSAIKIFDRDKDLRRKYWGMHFWSIGYFVSTVGVNEEQVVKHVRFQQKKDCEQDSQENLFGIS